MEQYSCPFTFLDPPFADPSGLCWLPDASCCRETTLNLLGGTQDDQKKFALQMPNITCSGIGSDTRIAGIHGALTIFKLDHPDRYNQFCSQFLEDRDPLEQ
ncbi:hypothetical protein GF362_01945 [Candidatus Dojkabacteria bacterium]|nr:hypothetical protein [Candidatus Dojkabacteria bacterium]